jgi:hypothetical protein
MADAAALDSLAPPTGVTAVAAAPACDNHRADILRELDRLQEIELEQDGKRFLLRTPTTGVAGKLFQAVGVALPPNLQELPQPAPQSPA